MSSNELHYLELLDVGKRIQSKEISPVEATRAQLDRLLAELSADSPPRAS